MKDFRLVVLALAAALALVASVFLLSLALSPRPESRPETAAAPSEPAQAPPEALEARKRAVLAAIAETPEVQRFFDKLNATLPGDYAAALDRVAKLPQGGPDDTPDFWLSDAVRLVRQSHGVAAAKAESGPLGDVFTKQKAILDALATRDPRLCVDFLYGGASEGFFKFAAENRALVSDLAIAGLDAIQDGQKSKIDRGAPTDADFQALEDALKARGLNDAEVGALLDGKSPEPPLPDQRICEMGRTYIDVMGSLPDETRLRLYSLAVQLMARS